MSPIAFGSIVVVGGFAVATIARLLIRWALHARRRSRISTIAHQLEGPYRKRGQKRRK